MKREHQRGYIPPEQQVRPTPPPAPPPRVTHVAVTVKKDMEDVPLDAVTKCRTEYSVPFLQGMVNRMCMSFFKYGAVADAYPKKLNAITSLLLRLRTYLGPEAFEAACREAIDAPDTRHRRTDGNTEYLIDAANFAMIEFMHPRREGAHFEATDSDGSPGRVSVSGRTSAERNNHESEAIARRLQRDGD